MGNRSALWSSSSTSDVCVLYIWTSHHPHYKFQAVQYNDFNWLGIPLMNFVLDSVTYLSMHMFCNSNLIHFKLIYVFPSKLDFLDGRCLPEMGCYNILCNFNERIDD